MWNDCIHEDYVQQGSTNYYFCCSHFGCLYPERDCMVKSTNVHKLEEIARKVWS